MRIGLHDSDGVGFKYPNLALMKISAYFKSRGDSVEWWSPLLTYDRVYSAKVFTFTDENPYLPEGTIKGGTGYGVYEDLPEEIDGMLPDYSIYPDCNYAIGFLTRGCPNNCPWCCVPRKEGGIRPYREYEQIKRPDSNKMVFMDNNVIACQHGLDQIERLGNTKIKVDFNQGLDARLITPEIGKLLGRLHWNPYIRLACDQMSQIKHIETAHEYLLQGGVPKSKFFCYVLVKDIPSALVRVEYLRSKNIDPFAQPYRDFENKIEPTEEQRHFARWVNHKATFKSVMWEDYKP